MKKMGQRRQIFWPGKFFLGGKTGYTDSAGKTFAGVFSLPSIESPRREIAVIILKSQDRDDDMIKILDYLKNR